ncbi:MAG: PP2C family protein-serine/threonine phosphatase, partial [Bacteroidota bacterium]
EIQPGDRVFIYSDGYADQFGGEKGKKFKAKTLMNLLLKTSNLPMQEQVKQLDEAHEKWKGSFAQVDDVCVIGLKF